MLVGLGFWSKTRILDVHRRIQCSPWMQLIDEWIFSLISCWFYSLYLPPCQQRIFSCVFRWVNSRLTLPYLLSHQLPATKFSKHGWNVATSETQTCPDIPGRSGAFRTTRRNRPGLQISATPPPLWSNRSNGSPPPRRWTPALRGRASLVSTPAALALSLRRAIRRARWSKSVWVDRSCWTKADPPR